MKSLAPYRLTGLLALVSLLVVACGDDSDDEPNTRTATATATGTATSPGDTPAPQSPLDPPTSAGYEEAFSGLPGYDRPVSLVEVPGRDYMLLVLQEGRVMGFAKDGPYEEPATVLDHRDRTNYSGEQGMLAIAIDPAFEENRYVYVYYSAEGGERRSVISRMELTGEGTSLALDPASELVILSVPQPYPNHNGGQLLFGPDGMLYLGLGDGGSGGDPQGNAQNLEQNLLGSIIRIDVSGATTETPYTVPPDSPFIDSGAEPETWAYGFRNPWRMSFDRETGTLWVGDVGEASLEEINIVEAGGNYGWNVMEGSECFEPSSGCDQEGLTLPVTEYGRDDGCSVTGGHVYRGEAYPALQGWYLYSDYCSGNVWGLDTTLAAGDEILEPVLLWTGPGVASFAEDNDGELYAIAFEGGTVYRITAGE